MTAAPLPFVSALSSSRPVPSLPTNPSATSHTGATLLNALTAGGAGSAVLVLAIEADSSTVGGGRVYSGTQSGDINVWDLATLSLVARLKGHTGAVLAFQVVKERNWLISSSGDGTVCVWNTGTLSAIYVIHPPHDNVGDIFSLAWVGGEVLGLDIDDELGVRMGAVPARSRGRLFAGCQDTSIQWIDLPPAFHLEEHSQPMSSLTRPGLLSTSQQPSGSPPIHRLPNKFFDSITLSDRPRSHLSRNTSKTHSVSGGSLPGLMDDADPGPGSLPVDIQYEDKNVAHYAHFGYVYCLLLAKSNDQHVLLSGSGDSSLKLWTMTPRALSPVATLKSLDDTAGVLTVAVSDSTAFAGYQGGIIKIWDLDTLTCLKNLRPHAHDILTISTMRGSFLSGSADGTLQHWNKSFQLVNTWAAHDGIVLASTTSAADHLLTGGNDGVVKIWDVSDDEPIAAGGPAQGFQGTLFHTLAKLVSFQTIADDEHREECRQGALYLKRVLRELGADTVLLPGLPGHNPLVLATFTGNSIPASPLPRKRVLCYGHYDVVPASESADGWSSDPFTLRGHNGWIYGRGTSDNKGPMLAIAAAASDLLKRQELPIDLVMIIEGEEETGSAGFQEAIRQNRDLIGEIDVILVSNSYWIGEDIPCLTFGLRGVVHATINVKSDQPDLHSGLSGGSVSEPMVDMVRLLASLQDVDGRVRIPAFHEDVRKLVEEERGLYQTIIERCEHTPPTPTEQGHVGDPLQSLMNRWREPSLSIHSITAAGPSKTLIPSWATASLSIRIVPDQALDTMVESLEAHLQKSFSSLRTRNTMDVSISHTAAWWLGSLTSPYFIALAQAIESVWKIKPLFIREGGSIPSLPFLEEEFGAASVQFPMGMSSDSAHLPEERIRITNLEKGKDIVERWFTALSRLPREACNQQV